MIRPRHFLLFKIVGVVGAVATIAGIVLAITGFGNFENNNFIIGIFLAVIGVTFVAPRLQELLGAEGKIAKSLHWVEKEDPRFWNSCYNAKCTLSSKHL